MRGRLDAAPLLELFSALRRFRKSGSLMCSSASILLEITVEQGAIRSVTTSDPAFRIGQVLIQMGFITEEQIEQALALQTVAPDPERIGEVLVDVGFIAESAIGQAMAAQIASILAKIFNDHDRSLRFEEHAATGPPEPRRSPASDPLILTAAFLGEYWLGQTSASASLDDSGNFNLQRINFDSPADQIIRRLQSVMETISGAETQLAPDQPRVERGLLFLLDHLEHVELDPDVTTPNQPGAYPETAYSDHYLELIDRFIDVWELSDLTRGARVALLTMLNGERRYHQICTAIRYHDSSADRAIAELIAHGLIRSVDSDRQQDAPGVDPDSEDEDRTVVFRFFP